MGIVPLEAADVEILSSCSRLGREHDSFLCKSILLVFIINTRNVNRFK